MKFVASALVAATFSASLASAPIIAQYRPNWQNYRNYDFNRPAPGTRTYYADRYYRDSRHYRVRTLGYNGRIYRGSNGRFYCRRTDGTTGLIIGAAAGGLVGHSLASGRSATVGTLIGAGAGALLGRAVARSEVRCR